MMTALLTPPPAIASLPNLDAAIESAISRIPPLWPLGHFVAVNPFSGLVNQPFEDACAILQRTTGTAPVQSRTQYLSAYQNGEIQQEDLDAVTDAEWSSERLLNCLKQTTNSSEIALIATVADLLDEQRPHSHWSVFVVDEISKWCGVAFDENQTTWNSPWKSLGLFEAWREAAMHDRNPEAFGLVGFRAFVRSLPASADESIAHCMCVLDPQNLDPTDFLHRQLATISGWAGYIQYRVREDIMRGRQNPAMHELLAIRLAYDAALFNAFARDGIFRSDWRHRGVPTCDPEMLNCLSHWQSAYEIGFQQKLAHSLAAQPTSVPPVRPVAQAVFCIDVRSELIRRHLETALPGCDTIGFAGFFGFPVAHQTAGSEHAASRSPVLLVPPVSSTEKISPEDLAFARAGRRQAGAWKAFQNSAVSCFSFVESVGLAFGGVLGRFGQHKNSCCHPPVPSLNEVTPETRASLAEGALRNMSLTRNFARLVLICGHGSHSANNPYASALDCGACGGHAGDVNARLATASLNDPIIRKILATRGIHIPDDTIFLAGLHDTLADDVTLFDLAEVPASHARDLNVMQAALSAAGAATRMERSAALGLTGLSTGQLGKAIRARGYDISQVRPEWGLANNAALVVAPRSRSAALKLDGRVFLHNYDSSADTDLAVLTLILCAPVVVASWINLQYYASRISPEYYGSGDKALHNVVGGIGVMEGNGGDLKTGLPLQSIHDGKKFTHEPRRLTVYLDAPRVSIDQVLASQPSVSQLFDHGWIHLIALEGNQTYRRSAIGWVHI